MKTRDKVAILGLASLAVGLTIYDRSAHHATLEPLASPTQGPSCDSALWRHVYKPQRLAIHAQCLAVTGTIVSATRGQGDGVRHEADGDTHGWLRPDSAYTYTLNAGNISAEGGNLVFEIVCAFPVHQADAVQACSGWSDPVRVPPVGAHVRMTGAWVQDDNHAHWNEIHPVSSITVIP